MVRNIALAPIAIVAVASMALATDGAPTAQPHKRCGSSSIFGFGGSGIFGLGGVGYGDIGYGGVGYGGGGCGSCGSIGCGACGGVGYGGVGYGGVGYGGVGYGGVGYGGWGLPFAASATNAFNTNKNCAHCNDDTLYVNNKDATMANNCVNKFNTANVIA